MRYHFDRLDTKVRASDLGHESGCTVGELDNDKLITARQAAAILDLSKRQVQRLAADLDGRIVDGRWVFNLKAVMEYAEGKQHG